MTRKSFYKKLPPPTVIFHGLLCIFCTGINFGWPSPFIPKLQSEDFPLDVAVNDITLLMATGLLGLVIGCLTCSLLLDRIGRKYSLLITTQIHLVSFLAAYFSRKSLIFVHIARFVSGFLQPHTVFNVAIYFCEVAEPEVRGLLICLISAVWNGSVAFINLVGAHYSIETTSLIMSVFPVIFLIGFSFAPKSPYYLLMKDKIAEARESLIKIRADKNVEAELNQLQEDVKRQMSEKGNLGDLFFTESNRKALLIICIIFFLEIFSGHGPLTTFGQTFFSEVTNLLSKEWAAALVMLLQVKFVFISMLLVDHVGRRLLLLISLGGIVITLLLISAYFICKDYYSSKIIDYSWLIIIVIILYNGFFSIGLQPIAHCFKSELLPLKVKGIGGVVVGVFYSIFFHICIMLYQPLADYYCAGWPLLIFAFVEIGGFVYCWKYLPETKCKTLEEIQQELKQLNYIPSPQA